MENALQFVRHYRYSRSHYWYRSSRPSKNERTLMFHIAIETAHYLWHKISDCSIARHLKYSWHVLLKINFIFRSGKTGTIRPLQSTNFRWILLSLLCTSFTRKVISEQNWEKMLMYYFVEYQLHLNTLSDTFFKSALLITNIFFIYIITVGEIHYPPWI